MIFIVIAFCFFTVVIASGEAGKESSFSGTFDRSGLSTAKGPLRIHGSNPRYFTDGSGRAIYLTGSHTWSNFKDLGTTDPPGPFAYDSYLDFLQRYHHNFIRLWTWELPRYNCGDGTNVVNPFPWPRTGPGMASDGKPNFDLSRFDQGYFDRLRGRVVAARDKGIYVSIMLFEGYALQFCRLPQDGFPFSGGNNVNGIDAKGTSFNTLENPAVTVIQEVYVRKVIDTVNELDNVLFEISNESTYGSLAWQSYMIEFVHLYETTKPKQHPVLFTAARGYDGSELWGSRAEAISPGWPSANAKFVPYRDDPPANDGRKVIINDTDHLWGIGGDHKWVWKCFLRGLNPIFMDPYTHSEFQNHPGKPEWELIRKNMGYTLTYSRRVNLASMIPRNDLCSTNYCLANPGSEYLIYLPSSGHRGMRRLDSLGRHAWVNWFTGLVGWNESLRIDLSGSSDTYRVEWFNPRTGETIDGGFVRGGEGKSFTAPFTGDAVLYICKL